MATGRGTSSDLLKCEVPSVAPCADAEREAAEIVGGLVTLATVVLLQLSLLALAPERWLLNALAIVGYSGTVLFLLSGTALHLGVRAKLR